MISFSIEDRLKELGYALESISDGAQEAFKEAVVSVAQSAMAEWGRLAGARLKTSAEIYQQGLRQSESYKVTKTDGDGVRVDIQLVGEMPNNFEFGMAPFDMKSVRPGWLGGGKAKTGKDGSKYVVIPFRHSTGTNTRFDYTGKAGAITGPDLKTQLRKTVKQYGLDRALTAAVGEVATRRIPSNAAVHPYLKGLQKTEIAQGTASGGMKRSGQLNTFRIMSENSPASSWQHPGLKPANLLQEVEAFVDKELDRIMDMVLGA